MSSKRMRPAWHAREVSETLHDLRADLDGLSQDEAAIRLKRHGSNALPATGGRGPFRRLLSQCDNLLIYVLIGAALVSAVLGHTIDASVILAVVILNAAIGFIQEGRAEKALDAIRDMISPRASVLRDGRRVTVNAVDIVPGDSILLEAGDRVCADVRLMKARNLHIDEAVLTGESVPVEKGTTPVPEESALGDRKCMAYSGTLVTSGLGAGVVVATGSTTELGRISTLLSRVERLETPLIRQMNRFARTLTIVILALSAVTFTFAVVIRNYTLSDAFMTMVGMAVAAIPEGLPAVMTITLAIGVQRMAERNAIIRHLPAVETLGSVSTICSDKTGTFTRNEMTATKVILSECTVDVGGIGYAPLGSFRSDGHEIDAAGNTPLSLLGRTALLCNDASLRQTEQGVWVVDGDPMEGALVTLGLKTGYDRDNLIKDYPRLDEIPFDSEHRYMATLHRGVDTFTYGFVKGAPERILEMCSHQLNSTGQNPIDRDYWQRSIDELARQGHRVLALASRQLPGEPQALDSSDVEKGLSLQGIVGLIDPPRPAAIKAVAESRSAGIDVKMITGDHATTSSTIAAELGLAAPDAVLTGQMLDELDPSAFDRGATDASVFARTSPEHKLRLVEALQAGGKVIAMTGDGVNDAPALKRADVGVAMGNNGTEAAKEAADMVLADDNFASIVAAVREGRTVYDNLTKVISWTLPTNGGETLIIVAAILFGLTLPITPIQILWINMITAVGLGLVLAFEPAETDIMERAPRIAGAPILSAVLIWRIVIVSILFAIGAFGMFAWASSAGASLEKARTIVVNTIVVMEIFYLFSVRYLNTTSFTWQGTLGTPAVLIGVSSVMLLQIGFTYLPFLQLIFETHSLSIVEGGAVVAAGLILMIILEIEKVLRHKLQKRVTGS